MYRFTGQIEAFDVEAPGANTDRKLEDGFDSPNLVLDAALDVDGPGSALLGGFPLLDVFPWPGSIDERSILPT